MANKIILDHDIIRDIYVNNHKRIVDIANIYEVSPCVITRHLTESGVTIRKRGFGFNVAPEKKLTNTQYEFFDGLMLSDGSICRRKSLKGRHTRGNDFLSCAFKHEEFAKYIKSQLELKPEVHNKIHVSGRYKSGQCEQFGILSSPNIFFTKERDRWYPEGIKLIPRDCRITPTSLNIMYLGDGYIRKDKDNKSIYLSTHSFVKGDLKIITDYLYSVNIKSKIQADNQIRISSYNTQDFLNYIGDCPVECYRYKWKG